MAATLRLVWRLANGFPVALIALKVWERLMASGVHWALLMPPSSCRSQASLMTLGGGRDLVLFGWVVIAGGKKNELLAGFSHEVHEIGATVLIVIHILTALKHHVINRDGTLRQMLGRRVEN